MKMSIIEPEIKTIMHVPINFDVWYVPIPIIIVFSDREGLAIDTCPQYEEIKLHEYVGEKFKYGYGQKSKTLVIGDRA
jgi:hypothetical protein